MKSPFDEMHAAGAAVRGHYSTYEAWLQRQADSEVQETRRAEKRKQGADRAGRQGGGQPRHREALRQQCRDRPDEAAFEKLPHAGGRSHRRACGDGSHASR